MAKQRQLTFKPYAKPRVGGRWCKKIDGKTHYFGTAKSKSDRKSYNAAFKAYRTYCDQLLVEDEVERMAKSFFRGRLQAVYGDDWKNELKRLQSSDPLGDRSNPQLPGSEAIEITGCEPTDPSEPTLTDVMLLIERQAKRTVQPTKPKPGVVTIAGHIDAWLAAEKERWDSGDIGEVAYLAKVRGIKTFVTFAKDDPFGGREAIGSLLTDYRTYLLEAMRNKRFAGNTVNDKLKFLGQFIHWCYEREVLAELPRNLKRVIKKVAVAKSGEPLTVKQVRQLWAEADDRMRCWIALGLNCGFKNRDVGELRVKDLQGDRLLALRHKTGVPMNFKLWATTLELIEQTRQDDGGPEELLFVNRNGEPLVRGRTDRVGAAFRKVAKAAGVKATFQQLRDTGAEFVKKWSRTNGHADQAWVQLYLAHKDTSTAQFYLNNDPANAQADVLYAATAAMEESFDFVAA